MSEHSNKNCSTWQIIILHICHALTFIVIVSFLYSSQNCLRVTTGSAPNDDGVLNVFVDSGSGYVTVSMPGQTYGQGATVIDQCFHTIVGVQVSNQSTDGWTGVFELSTDGKATYFLLICSDCTGTTNTMPIAVDGNDDATDLGPTTWCFEGEKCTLTVSILQLLDIVWYT